MMDPYKGVRDFYPEDQRVQNHMFAALRRTAESFGYDEYNASILEPSELYAAKSSDEIVNEQTYTFEDRGGRSVTLRPEMTPTVARMVANRKRELGYPLRWYCIQNFFRYDRQQRGRLREFWQFNVDLFGVPVIEADAEVIEIAYRSLTALGVSPEDFVLKIGSRVALQEAFDKAGLTDEARKRMRILLDKRAKISQEEFLQERQAITAEPIEDMLGSAPSVMALLELLKERDVHVEYDPSIVRGFDYYTDIVFEAFDRDPQNARSILGGGRYDSLVEKYGSEPVHAVGFAMGDVVLRDFLETHHKLPTLPSSAHLYLAALPGSESAARTAVQTLRDTGVNVALGMKHEKVSDHIRNAAKLGIPYIAIYGENEATSGELALKNLHSGTETRIAVHLVHAFILGTKA
ncbi:MAG: histidine--tRNA ligase [Candidatus Pacebacteria bacterium]|nr:histidine--tRNA ligase [Candidatus Paceibacterota bacterium]